jgi:hypothetical protein
MAFMSEVGVCSGEHRRAYLGYSYLFAMITVSLKLGVFSAEAMSSLNLRSQVHKGKNCDDQSYRPRFLSILNSSSKTGAYILFRN